MIESLILQVADEWRAQSAVFDEIFFVFLALGTLVGTIVVSYTLYNAYKYRDDGSDPGEKFDPPVLGELPTGQGGPKAKKLFLSFGLSAIVVISLVVYAYGLLLYVEEGPATDVEEDIEITVEGYQFGWEFQYPDEGVTTQNTLRVPQDKVVQLRVTSRDVWHNFGVSELRIKSDAIPGEYSETWFSGQAHLEEPLEPGETETYTAECFELCGSGHSYMKADVIIMHEEDYQDWYDEQLADAEGEETEGDG
ncbi:hypothetical protein GCM10027435_00730 [Haloparvum alkalitolerans]|uniref:cytochrome c oxidase subunit II n=1 Tax=Haloparvum alkalitolerans TaxID=1042953 RepID=UPI003CE98231